MLEGVSHRDDIEVFLLPDQLLRVSLGTTLDRQLESEHLPVPVRRFLEWCAETSRKSDATHPAVGEGKS